MKKIPLRILSYNIHKGFSSYNRRFVLNSIRAALHLLHPDLILLQEVVGQNDAHALNHPQWPKSTQFEFLAENLWPHFTYGKNAVYSGGHHGNAILSKFPILDSENIDVSTNPFESRGALHALIQLPRDKAQLHVICTHLGLLEKDRKRQIEKLSQRISYSVPQKEPLVVAGDFNDWREQATRTFMKQSGIEEAFFYLNQAHARTFPSWLPIFCLDRIYFRGMTPISAECLTGKPWSQLSDHTAIIAQLNA